jgi:hypothetical protein
MGLIALLAWSQSLEAMIRFADIAIITIVFVGANVLFLIREMKRGAWVFWSPVFSMRVASTLFFGLGTLVAFWANIETRLMIQDFYSFTEVEAAKTQAVLFFGHFVAVSAATLIEQPVAYHPQRRPAAHAAGIDAGIWALIAAGGALNVFMFLNAALGLGGILPGALGALATGLYAALFIGAYQALSRRSIISFCVVAAIAMTTSLVWVVQFSKTNTLVPLVVVMAAWSLARVSVLRALVVVSTAAALYFYISDPITLARNRTIDAYGQMRTVTLSARAEIWSQSWKDARDLQASDASGGLARLAYVNATSFAVSRYDLGAPGESIGHFWELLVPRILWKDKPVRMRDADFNEAITGSRNSLSNPGLSAEGYWNFGWWGVAFVNIVFGLAMGVWANVSRRIFLEQNWFLAPVIFTGLMYGQSTVQMFVPAVLGPLPMAIVIFVILKMAHRLIAVNASMQPVRLASSRELGSRQEP